MAMFYDLNLMLVDKFKMTEAVGLYAKLGYEVIAVTKTCESSHLKSLQNSDQNLPETLEKEVLAPLKIKSRRFRQLSRLTVIINDQDNLHRLSHEAAKSYDILAVQPTSEKTFLASCTQIDADIISLDLTERLPFMPKFHQIKAAINRGIHFEINYSPIIRDSSLRKNVLSNVAIFMKSCKKGKNIILSSGAEKVSEIRGPYDVANLGLLFNLNEEQSKDAVSTNCRAVLLHSDARRKVTNSTILVRTALSLASRDQWTLREIKATKPVVQGNDDDSETEVNSNSSEKDPLPKKKRKLDTKT